MKFLNLISLTIIFLAIFCTESFSQARWEKVSDRPAGVTDFEIFTFDENGQKVQFCNSINGEGLFKSTDGGVNWTNVGLMGLILTDMTDPYASNPGTYLVSAEDGVYKTTDGGLNWTHITSGIEGLWINTIDGTFTPGEVYAGTANNGLYRSTDGGESWDPFNTGMENSTVLDFEYNAFTGELFATTAGEGAWNYNSSLQTWEQINQGNNNLVNNAITGDSEGNLYMCSTPYLLSTDSLLNYIWAQEYFHPACEDLDVVTDVVIDGRALSDDLVLAASLGFGVALRDENGMWGDFSSGLPADNQGFIDVKNISIDSDGRAWAAVTPLSPNVDGGIYRTIEPVTNVEEIESDIPISFNLEQNYPNPFNPTTTIRYRLPKAAHVKINLFNIRGQWVASPVEENKTSGYHEVQFDGSNLPSGVYLYRIEADNFSDVKKMILLR